MKSLFPHSTKNVELIRLGEEYTCDVYVWTSPEDVKIATHMIMSCPRCGYPLSLATSEFNFEEKTLGHKVKCPARWKKMSQERVGDKHIRLAALNEKGSPIIQRCGWRGYIINGEVVTNDN